MKFIFNWFYKKNPTFFVDITEKVKTDCELDNQKLIDNLTKDFSIHHNSIILENENLKKEAYDKNVFYLLNAEDYKTQISKLNIENKSLRSEYGILSEQYNDLDADYNELDLNYDQACEEIKKMAEAINTLIK